MNTPRKTKTTKAISGTKNRLFRSWDNDELSFIESLTKRPALQVVLFVSFIAIIGFIITGFSDERNQSEFELREVAPRDLISSKSFSFSERNVEATKIARDKATENTPQVFDWSESLRSSIRDNISIAFSSSRRALENQLVKEFEAGDPKVVEKLNETVPEVQRRFVILKRSSKRARIRAAKASRSSFESALKITVDDSDFSTFASAAFSDELENAVSTLVDNAMDQMIVKSRRVLEGASDVTLRRVRGQSVILEYRLENAAAQFTPLEEVPAMVRRIGRAKLNDIETPAVQESVIRLATQLTTPNIKFNVQQSESNREAARRHVQDVMIQDEFKKGQIIIDKGHVVTQRHLRIIERMGENEKISDSGQVVAGVFLFCILLVLVLFLFGQANITKFKPTTRDTIFLASVLVLGLLLARSAVVVSDAVSQQIDFIPANAWWYAMPVATTGMLIRLILNSEFAVIFALLFAALVGVMTDQSFAFAWFVAVSCLIGAGTVGQVKDRMTLVWSGVFVGIVNTFTISALLLIQGEFFSVHALAYILFAFGGGVISGFLVTGILPLFETIFGYTTDIKLLELANLNHPALRELIVRAPGSYHHSMMVGALCENAAEAIGCNPLLARVGAYYHDIGKAKNPAYFAENQKSGNPHDKLKASMSALIIKAHVKDGVEMAKQHRLPKVIQDFIAQHHGTNLIAYFYHKAKKNEDPNAPTNEDDYRYPGPKPQFRETAICLLADGIEAASRAMAEPTEARLKGLVQKMINKAFTDGQLDECDLTLKDLNKIAKAFNLILNGIYHHRPEYPEQKKAVENEARSKEKKLAQRTRAIEEGVNETHSIERDRKVNTAESETKKDNENGSTDKSRGESQSAPEDQSDPSPDPNEDRESLPRLGNDGS